MDRLVQQPNFSISLMATGLTSASPIPQITRFNNLSDQNYHRTLVYLLIGFITNSYEHIWYSSTGRRPHYRLASLCSLAVVDIPAALGD